jgi:hypothetical protein
VSSDFRLPFELDRDVKEILMKARALIAASEFTSAGRAEVDYSWQMIPGDVYYWALRMRAGADRRALDRADSYLRVATHDYLERAGYSPKRHQFSLEEILQIFDSAIGVL